MDVMTQWLFHPQIIPLKVFSSIYLSYPLRKILKQRSDIVEIPHKRGNSVLETVEVY